jgi:GNAT superfamily N-acetyltransferase
MEAFQRLADENEWRRLRDIRLIALQESPDFFLSTYEKELGFAEQRWRAEFVRGVWTIGCIDGHDVCLLGTTREEDTPPNECWLEYMWVHAGYRRQGIAGQLVRQELNRLRADGFKLARLWVLDGNDPATDLYKSLNFRFNGTSQALQAKPGRFEIQMELELIQENLGSPRERRLTAFASSY